MAGRYSDYADVLGDSLVTRLHDSRILVVGAGGIGCELLKNMVMSGFHNIEVIDLDTIDLSNLNRQFLFRKHHIDMPKATVARDSSVAFNEKCNIKAYHSNIKESQFGFEYFKSFDLVLMALDNIDARKHVNRLCLAANVPVVESGTAGYLGQVQVIKKDKFECYECRAKPRTKSYAYCTIHNTPSKPIHCIVWAKIKFSDNFSAEAETKENEEETTNDLSSDPVMQKEETELQAEFEQSKARWLFRKLFHRDILQRCRMAELSGKDIWKGVPPTPILPPAPSNQSEISSKSTKEWTDQSVLSMEDNIKLFLKTAEILFKRAETGPIDWDKDDEDALHFVVSASNIRCEMFQIKRQSKFEIKAIAGNIIPAIATTNAVIAGLIVLEAFKILAGNIDSCKYVYFLRKPSGNRLVMDVNLEPPNSQCYVCSSKQIQVKVDVEDCTLERFVKDFLQKELGMVFPCLFIDTRNIYECSDDMDEEDIENMKEQAVKTLQKAGLHDGITIRADDEFQDVSIDISIVHTPVQADSKESTEEIPYFSMVNPNDSKTNEKEDETSKKRSREESGMEQTSETEPTKKTQKIAAETQPSS